MVKKTIVQKHHIIYDSDRNKEVVRNVRKGVHQILTLIGRYKWLEDEEINAILIETEMKRKFGKEII